MTQYYFYGYPNHGEFSKKLLDVKTSAQLTTRSMINRYKAELVRKHGIIVRVTERDF